MCKGKKNEKSCDSPRMRVSNEAKKPKKASTGNTHIIKTFTSPVFRARANFYQAYNTHQLSISFSLFFISYSCFSPTNHNQLLVLPPSFVLDTDMVSSVTQYYFTPRDSAAPPFG